MKPKKTLLTYCHGADMPRCASCKHGENFADLHELPQAEQRVLKADGLMVNQSHCAMTRGGLYAPVKVLA